MQSQDKTSQAKLSQDKKKGASTPAHYGRELGNKGTRLRTRNPASTPRRFVNHRGSVATMLNPMCCNHRLSVASDAALVYNSGDSTRTGAKEHVKSTGARRVRRFDAASSWVRDEYGMCQTVCTVVTCTLG